MLSKELMREVVLEHVEAENVNDPGRVLAVPTVGAPLAAPRRALPYPAPGRGWGIDLLE
ncbi:MAG: hypothetical protein Q7R32_02310 [Dehalococcoidia bacterium]|nr:hypothetical protein [Dehalococcoidia bacterium]